MILYTSKWKKCLPVLCFKTDRERRLSITVKYKNISDDIHEYKLYIW